MNDNNKALKFSNKKALEVIEPYNPQIVEFESVDDFNDYYNKHSSEFNDKTTQKLNTKYKIPGYRLTKEKGQLKLIKDYYRRTTNANHPTNEPNNETINSLLNRISILERQIKEITDYLQRFTEA